MKQKTYILLILIPIFCYLGKLDAQSFHRTDDGEIIDSITFSKINGFLNKNYPKHFNDFNLHFCKIYERGDSIRDRKNTLHLIKYLFVYTFSDSFLGITNYCINISFDKNFHLIDINFPYNSKYKELKIATRNQIINEFIAYKPSLKDSIQYIKADIVYDKNYDRLLWEVCIEEGQKNIQKRQKNFNCIQFDAIDRRFITMSGKLWFNEVY